MRIISGACVLPALLAMNISGFNKKCMVDWSCYAWSSFMLSMIRQNWLRLRNNVGVKFGRIHEKWLNFYAMPRKRTQISFFFLSRKWMKLIQNSSVRMLEISMHTIEFYHSRELSLEFLNVSYLRFSFKKFPLKRSNMQFFTHST